MGVEAAGPAARLVTGCPGSVALPKRRRSVKGGQGRDGGAAAGSRRSRKSEGRRSKAERRPKAESLSASGFGLRISELGLLSGFGLQS